MERSWWKRDDETDERGTKDGFANKDSGKNQEMFTWSCVDKK